GEGGGFGFDSGASLCSSGASFRSSDALLRTSDALLCAAVSCSMPSYGDSVLSHPLIAATSTAADTRRTRLIATSPPLMIPLSRPLSVWLRRQCSAYRRCVGNQARRTGVIVVPQPPPEAGPGPTQTTGQA